MRSDEVERTPVVSPFLFSSYENPHGTSKKKKTKNESMDLGMFHNSNRHCLGFITSSTHPSPICLGCCHLIANSPVRLVSS